MYDFIVVGSGFAGSTIANILASKYDKKILVVEKRGNVSGNMYDKYDEHGFLIQQYGPHLFFTNSDLVLDYVSQFDNLIPHDCVMLSYLEGKYIQLPFNFKSIQQLVGYKKAKIIINRIRDNFSCNGRISIFELMNHNDRIISEFGELLYKLAFETYICKQWGLEPSNISKDVINRCKFSPNYVYRYLDKDFQFLPEHGFHYLISQMLNHKNITVRLNEDAKPHLKIIENKIIYDDFNDVPVIYTGSIDELFDYKFGKLPYRSLEFKIEYTNEKKSLPCEIISMPQDPIYIRKTEYKYFAPKVVNEEKNISVVVYERPYQYDYKKSSIQCYPIINDDNNLLYSKYLESSKKVSNLYLCGRLAEYRYFNMDEVILHAMELAEYLGKEK